jgi:hypothetical protein
MQDRFRGRRGVEPCRLPRCPSVDGVGDCDEHRNREHQRRLADRLRPADHGFAIGAVEQRDTEIGRPNAQSILRTSTVTAALGRPSMWPTPADVDRNERRDDARYFAHGFESDADDPPARRRCPVGREMEKQRRRSRSAPCAGSPSRRAADNREGSASRTQHRGARANPGAGTQYGDAWCPNTSCNALMIGQFGRRWKCGKGSSLFAKFVRRRIVGRFDRLPTPRTARVCSASQKPLRSCHKWPESVVGPGGLTAGNDRSLGPCNRRRVFRARDKTCFRSMYYESERGGFPLRSALKSGRDEQRDVNTCRILRLSTVAVRSNDQCG